MSALGLAASDHAVSYAGLLWPLELPHFGNIEHWKLWDALGTRSIRISGVCVEPLSVRWLAQGKAVIASRVLCRMKICMML